MKHISNGVIGSRIDNGEKFIEAMCENPITTGAAGATIIVGGCIGMVGAVELSLMLLIILPIIGIMSAIEMERMQPSLRRLTFCAIAAILVFLLSLAFDAIIPESIVSLGVFVLMVAVDSLTLARTRDEAEYISVQEGISEGLAWGCAFALMALPVAFVRELIGSGRLFNAYLGFKGMGSFRMPFMGFILCGASVAIYRVVVTKCKRGGKA